MLELHDLECVRGAVRLFSGISATLDAGCGLRVRGANGAGKTSLLRMICGLSLPHRGAVRWNGEAIGGLREEYARQLVYLGHGAALKDDLSAAENLHASCVLGGIATHAGAIAGALIAAGLAGREHLPVRFLSQGQKRRAALARLPLAASAPLWVLDEPFNALDATAIDWLRDLLAAHLKRGGMLVLTSHQAIAEDLGTRRMEIAL